jgi:hypothetical protein
MKRVILSVIAVAAALIVLLDFFIDYPVVNRAGAILTDGAIILTAFAMILGLFNLLSVHAERIQKHDSSWVYSAVLVLGLLMVLFFGFGGQESAPVKWIFRYVYSPLQATIFSLLAFFVVSAAYRAFRIRNWETALFVLAGVIVLLGQVPVGELIWGGLPALKDWLLAVPVTAGVRGIILGVALGTIIAGLRILLLMDRPYLE